MKNSILYILLVTASLSFFTSCDDEVVIPNEEELITTLIYTLTPTDSNDVVTLSFTDLDGDGGDDPTIVNGTLRANTEYEGEIMLLNETETPVEDITVEVIEEAEEHQFFYELDAGGIVIDYDDTDANLQPIGIKTTLNTRLAGVENLKITLIHEPDKSAENVSTGDITNAGGEADIEVSFKITVQ